MIIRSAAAKFAVLRADSMTELCDLSRDEICIRQCGDQIADELRFADAACMSADDDQAIGTVLSDQPLPTFASNSLIRSASSGRRAYQT